MPCMMSINIIVKNGTAFIPQYLALYHNDVYYNTNVGEIKVCNKGSIVQ